MHRDQPFYSIALLIALTALLMTSIAFATPKSEFSFDPKTGTIQKYLGTEVNLVIPSSINSVKVKGIGVSAFESNIKIKTLKLPDTIKSIEKFAFKNCTALTSITTPAHLLKIDRAAFEGCKALTRSFIVALETKVQNNNNPLKNYSFNKTTGTITNYYGVNDEVIIPSSINGTTIKRIARTTFYRNSSITKVVIPESVTEVEQQTFLDCTSLKSVRFPKAVTEIGLQMFWNCKHLKSVTLPEELISIGEQAFAHCTALERITLPEKLEEIGPGAFQNCKLLDEIIIPNSVLWVKQGAFMGCDNLKSVTFLGEDPLSYGGSSTFPNHKIIIASPFVEEYAALAESLGFTFIKLDK